MSWLGNKARLETGPNTGFQVFLQGIMSQNKIHDKSINFMLSRNTPKGMYRAMISFWHTFSNSRGKIKFDTKPIL